MTWRACLNDEGQRQKRYREILAMLKALTELDNDRLPGPQAISAESRQRTPGPAANGQTTCGCGRLTASGWTGNPGCLLCYGTGWRQPLPIDPGTDHDERGLLLDPMTYDHDREAHAHRVRNIGQPGERTMTQHELDTEIERLRADARARAGVIRPDEAYAYERARQRAEQTGHFAELRILVVSMPTGLLPGSQVGLHWLEERLPNPLRLPRNLAETLDLERRRARVQAVFDRTGSLNATALECGIHRTKVRDLLRGNGAAA